MSWPKRLKKQLSAFSIPAASSASPRPSAVSSRMACGNSVMPTPSSFTSGAASYTRQAIPRACRLSARASPQIPPPTSGVVILVIPGRRAAASPESITTNGAELQKSWLWIPGSDPRLAPEVRARLAVHGTSRQLDPTRTEADATSLHETRGLGATMAEDRYFVVWTVKREGVILPEERLPTGPTVLVGLQHVVAMFGATVLAPILMGFDPNVAIFFSGIATLIFFVATGGRVPSYLGSSFAFIGPVLTATGAAVAAGANPNIGVALGGIIAAGALYTAIGLIVLAAGHRWVERLMPPVLPGRPV